MRRSALQKINGGGGGGGYNFEQALRFDATNDFCNTNQTISYDTFTIGCWFKCNAINKNQTFIGNENIAFFKLGTNNKIQFRTSTISLIFNIPSIAINTWNHIAATRDSNNNVKVYFNGIESTTGSLSETASLSYNIIGGFLISGNISQVFNGDLDDVIITNSFSSASQIAEIALGKDPLTIIPTLEQLYRFNNNGDNDGTLGGSLTLNNFIANPYVAH